MIKIYVILATVITVWLLYVVWKAKERISYLEREQVDIIDTMAWKHESNLKLIKKTVQKRISTLEKNIKQQQAAAKAEKKDAADAIASLERQLVESRNSCRIWYFCATVTHSLALPKTILVVAPDRKTAINLVNNTYNLEDSEIIYTVTGLKDKTARIVTTGECVL